MLTLNQYFKNSRAYNDENRQFSNNYNDIKNIDTLGNEKLLIFDDIDAIFDKRTWNYKVNQTQLQKIQRRLANCRHTTKEHPPQTIIFTGRSENIYSGLTSNASVDIIIRNKKEKKFIIFVIEKDAQKFSKFTIPNSIMLGSKT